MVEVRQTVGHIDDEEDDVSLFDGYLHLFADLLLENII